jgi:formamidopyrimidine-DNA glycosylase
MPELPEIEATRKLLDHALKGRKLTKVEAREDDIVFKGTPPTAIEEQLRGRTVSKAGRRGKFFWIEFEDGGALMGHLGMSGAVYDVSKDETHGVSYRESKSMRVDAEGEPRFLKLRLEAGAHKVVITDARRLGRLWLVDSVVADKTYKSLGPDAMTDLPTKADLAKKIAKRKVPIKALLLNQSFLAGIGNYLADEILYEARIAPARLASSLSEKESGAVHDAIVSIIKQAVAVNADSEKFPKDWLFHHRWGGSRGAERIGGQEIKRDTVGGRTTAWVPSRQK